jgi:hypothetical protein
MRVKAVKPKPHTNTDQDSLVTIEEASRQQMLKKIYIEGSVPTR